MISIHSETPANLHMCSFLFLFSKIFRFVSISFSISCLVQKWIEWYIGSQKFRLRQIVITISNYFTEKRTNKAQTAIAGQDEPGKTINTLKVLEKGKVQGKTQIIHKWNGTSRNTAKQNIKGKKQLIKYSTFNRNYEKREWLCMISWGLENDPWGTTASKVNTVIRQRLGNLAVLKYLVNLNWETWNRSLLEGLAFTPVGAETRAKQTEHIISLHLFFNFFVEDI